EGKAVARARSLPSSAARTAAAIGSRSVPPTPAPAVASPQSSRPSSTGGVSCRGRCGNPLARPPPCGVQTSADRATPSAPLRGDPESIPDPCPAPTPPALPTPVVAPSPILLGDSLFCFPSPRAVSSFLPVFPAGLATGRSTPPFLHFHTSSSYLRRMTK